MYSGLGQKADWSRLKKRERGKETEQTHYFNKFGYKMRQRDRIESEGNEKLSKVVLVVILSLILFPHKFGIVNFL